MVDLTEAAVNQITGCVWPMGYHVADFHSHGDIVLKNAVALVIPSIYYGPRCFQNLVANNTDFAGLGTITLANMPAMTVTKVELEANQKITGNAHVEFDASDNPIMKMDDVMSGSTDVLAAAAPNMGVPITPSSNSVTYVGGIPVTPDMAGADVTMTIYFDLTVTDATNNTQVYHCTWSNPSPMNVNGNIMRSYRTEFRANMSDPTYWNRIQLVSMN